MIAVVDSEATAEAPAPAGGPTKSTDAHREEVLAVYCKKLSFDIYTSINKLSYTAEDQSKDINVPIDTMRSWMEQLKELNCRISEYTRASVARVDRLQIEIQLAQNAMASDLLDREACHTHTLEAIGRLQTGEEPSSSVTPLSSARVTRALKLVMQWNASTKPFTETEAQSYFGAAQCRDASTN